MATQCSNYTYGKKNTKTYGNHLKWVMENEQICIYIIYTYIYMYYVYVYVYIYI